MRNFIICALTLFVFTGSFAYAGSGHSHGPVTLVNEQQAVDNATVIVQKFVERGQLAKSWQGVTAGSSSIKKTSAGQEWLITFNNDKIADKAKQTLYVFLNLGGSYIAANYTGK